MSNPPIPLKGSCNFRDLGGFAAAGGKAIVRGRAYRADALHRLVAEDLEVLEPLGIGTVFDLRSDVEVEKDGIGAFVADRCRHVHLPLVEVSLSPFDPEINWQQLNLQDRYAEMLRSGGQTIRAIFEALAAPDAPPIVFHCTGGKDRTGVVAAVLLRSLGVADEDVVADYAASQAHLGAFIEGYREDLEAFGMDPAAIAYLTSSPPDRMRRTLEQLDGEWGSTDGYLDWIGLDGGVRDALGRNLLEPA